MFSSKIYNQAKLSFHMRNISYIIGNKKRFLDGGGSCFHRSATLSDESASCWRCLICLRLSLKEPMRSRIAAPTPVSTGLSAAPHTGTCKSVSTGLPAAPQRAKNPVSVSALLTGKILRVRKIFARIVYNFSLKGPILSRQC